jgi:ATP-dependent RNA helicase RhlE
LSEFKDGKLQVLVATDIAARGIDIDQLPYVVNYELPQVAEDYVHRIGRTGRAGATGLAVSLVCVDEFKLLKDIERLTHREFTRYAVKGFEPDLSVKPEPIQKPRTGGRSSPANRGGARTGSAKTATPQNRTNRPQGPTAHGAKKPASGHKPSMHRTGGRGQ